MITKEQIEKVAHHYSHVWDEYDAFVAGAEWSLEQCPYSWEDMRGFIEFLFTKGYYLFTDGLYTLDELFKMWEEQKNG